MTRIPSHFCDSDRPSQPLTGWYLPTLFVVSKGRRFSMPNLSISTIALRLRAAQESDRSTQSGRCRLTTPT
ncbi:MAG: hypothetical protein HC895_20440 [Leptolyngbyaceae cyanobacterium SM1_3_5]|nr:hypothetical protein [Leptolyngbyaceae cyanobacterium SM1_3_5]